MTTIHPTAVVSPEVELGRNVQVGPFCVLEGPVRVGDDSILHSHVVLKGRTTIGTNAEIFPFASVGHRPQDLKYSGEESCLSIGDYCTIREHVTINPGTSGGGLETRIGDHVLLMAGAHVAHDCHLGDHVIMVNQSTLAGHCLVDSHAIVGGLSGVHQFVRIGAHAFVGAMSMVENDVIPYGSVLGNRAYLGGLNLVGLKRRNFDREEIHTLRAAYRMIFSNEGTLRERVEDAAELFEGHKLVEDVVAFVRKPSERAICMPKNGVDVGS
ncbi:acyl-ACP--UDP-N-acetylglucosamine O-acyltransferase [Maritalea sp. P4.10X]|uniref:Acyl-[acyl-carrier-protein]--UDP-N-acetylglucosamine O-acyltransferase n=1 Tax=Maritalea mediterranea TaxID=2909667 RepID=A0ABS9E6Q4_9HYPH|nr:acyl-ACP--UDP-N-acetylglucosamine O-acyltransferase [Maritalea mediterranea]MCF4098554.1 acyl-ACP--UDP-N-acetylglucosamine O-acyltransferase [Maritalea mediterranea]